MIPYYEKYLNLLPDKRIFIVGRGFLADRFREWSRNRDNPFFFKDSYDNIDYNVDFVINLHANTNVNGGLIASHFNRNIEFATYLAKQAENFKFKLCHVSTADLYESGNYLAETSPISCNTPYYCSKYLGEQSVLELNPNSLIVRPRLLFDERNNKKNLINKLISYSSVYNLNQSLTSTDCLIAAILYLFDSGKYGIYNVSEKGFVNFSDYFPNKKILNEGVKEIVLNYGKLQDAGFHPADANKSFQSCLLQRRE